MQGGSIQTSSRPEKKSDLANPDFRLQVWKNRTRVWILFLDEITIQTSSRPENPDFDFKSRKSRLESGFCFRAKPRFRLRPDLRIPTSTSSLENPNSGLDCFLSENPIPTSSRLESGKSVPEVRISSGESGPGVWIFPTRGPFFSDPDSGMHIHLIFSTTAGSAPCGFNKSRPDENPDLANPDFRPENPDFDPMSGKSRLESGYCF